MKNLIILILCSVSLFSCSKEDVVSDEFLKVDSDSQVSRPASPKAFECDYQLIGFADFPAQANVIEGQDYPYCTPQLCILVENWDNGPFFSISSSTLKICETEFATMQHHSTCADFEPIQISYLNYSGGNEIQFFFSTQFWDCFDPGSVYPGMKFQFEHGNIFIS